MIQRLFSKSFGRDNVMRTIFSQLKDKLSMVFTLSMTQVQGMYNLQVISSVSMSPMISTVTIIALIQKTWLPSLNSAALISKLAASQSKRY